MGLCVTVNSDDPPLFNTTLTQEYARLLEVFGLDEDDLQRLVLNAVRATFLPAEEKRRMEEDFIRQFAQLRID
jgi:adenosine deaminase